MLGLNSERRTKELVACEAGMLDRIAVSAAVAPDQFDLCAF
jgi:hypothetical protein